MDKQESIGINIWDDYDIDTYIYVEDDLLAPGQCRNAPEEHKACLEYLLPYILSCPNMGNAKFSVKLYDSRKDYPGLDEIHQYKQWQIIAEYLTDEARRTLVEELNNEKLSYQGYPLDIYSES